MGPKFKAFSALGFISAQMKHTSRHTLRFFACPCVAVGDLWHRLRFTDFQQGQRKDQPTAWHLRRTAELTQERCELTTV